MQVKIGIMFFRGSKKCMSLGEITYAIRKLQYKTRQLSVIPGVRITWCGHMEKRTRALLDKHGFSVY